MNLDAVLDRRAADPRVPSVAFPAGGKRNPTMSDAHEIMEILKDTPSYLLSYESRTSIHVLSLKSNAVMKSPDVRVEMRHREDACDADPERIRRAVLRTLQAAFLERGDRPVVPEDDMDSLRRLASLAAIRTETDDDHPFFEWSAFTPTPWSEIAAVIPTGMPGCSRQAIAEGVRAAWSGLVHPTVTVSQNMISGAKLSIVLRPGSTAFEPSAGPMERLRLERDMADMLAGVDDGTAW